MIKRAFVEIGNICNLKCSFCPGTSRAPRQMSEQEFTLICSRLSGKIPELLFHVMGEPLCHPRLSQFLKIAGEAGFRVSVTTNGSLLAERGCALIENAKHVHRVSISLHAPEGNGKKELSAYLDAAVKFARELAERGSFAVFRLWNLDTEERCAENSENAAIEKYLRASFGDEWQKTRSGYRLAKHIFLEYDGIFTWPVESCAEPEDEGSCHALRHQIAILADGTVVPCCLDSDGEMPLGNIFDTELEAILNSDMACRMREGFRAGKIVHPFCKTCTYRRRFS